MLPDDPDATARLFYMVMLGMVLVVGVFAAYRNRMGQAMQHAAIWALIFVGVMLAFGFKDNIQQQLFNEPTQIGADTIVLNRGGGRHFEAVLEVNGTRVSFLVDTGATHLVLNQRDAERVGLDPGRLDYSARAMTANGEVRSAPITLDEVRLGSFTDRRVAAMVNGGSLNVSLLGMTYLERYKSWRVEGDRMFLTR